MIFDKQSGDKYKVNKINIETIQQYHVYTWITRNFICENIHLTIVDHNTLLINDQKDTALVSFKEDTIYLRYSENYDFVVEKIKFKKPYH